MTTAAPALDDDTTAGATGADLVRGALTDGRERFDEARQAFDADDPEAVHDMRVALRRMRSALRSFARLLDSDETAPLAEEFKWLGGVLGQARDLEVLDDWLHGAVDDLPSSEGASIVVAGLVAEVDARQQRAEELATIALEGERVARMRERLDAVLLDLPVRGRGLRPATETVPALLERDVRRLRQALRQASRRQRHGSEHAHEAWHHARKRAKELRYACEVAEPALGEPAALLADAAKAIQSSLGDLQDSVVAREVIDGALASPLLSELDVAALRHLRAREDAVEAEVLAGIDDLAAALPGSRQVRL